VQRGLRQRKRPTEFPRDFHIWESSVWAADCNVNSFTARSSMVFRLELENADIPAHGF
jgi:hypothetical protein